MNEMITFENKEFGWSLHSFMLNGNPCFWIKDTVDILKLVNPRSSLALLDDDEKGVHSMDTPGGKQNINYVTEAGLYTLVLKSRRDEAKAFRRWITHEVIPSIRKHGMYATPKTMEQMLNDPDFAIRLLQEIKSERQKNSVLEAKKNELEAKIEEDRPMTEFGIAISTSEGCVTIAQFSALLCQKGVDTGEKRMFAEMREDGFLNSTGSYYNKPAQRFLDNKTMEYKVYKNKFTNQVTFQPLITPKGIQYFMDYYLRKHGKLPLLTVHRRTVIEKRPNYRQQRTEQQVKMSDINSSI